MKKVVLSLVSILFTIVIWAQSPEKISYQAIVRDANQKLVINKLIGVRINILKDSATGESVYSETHNMKTNANGLVSLKIGTGTTEDDFSTIDWSSGTHFIKVETDLNGGTDYSIIGTSELLSVPYALHSKAADYVKNSSRIVVKNEQELISALKIPNASIEIKSNTEITIHSTIEVAQGVHLNGNNNSLIASQKDFAMFYFKQGANNCLFENLQIVGQRVSAVNKGFTKSNVGIKLNRAYKNVFKNIHFKNFSGACMTFQGSVSDDVYAHRSMVLGCSFSNSFIGLSHTDRYEYSIVSNCFFSRCRVGIIDNSGNWNVTGNSFVTCSTPLLAVNKTTPYGTLSSDNWAHGMFSSNKIEHSASGGGTRWNSNLGFTVGGTSFTSKGGVHIEGVIPPTIAANSFYFSNLTFKNPETGGSLFYVNSATFQNSTIYCNISNKIKLNGCNIRSGVTLTNVLRQ